MLRQDKNGEAIKDTYKTLELDNMLKANQGAHFNFQETLDCLFSVDE